MIGRNVLIELMHMAAGIVLALAMAWGASWAVPLARGDIWLVVAFVIAAILLMGVEPLRHAAEADQRAMGAGQRR
ncbi:hypothetical protein [Sphingomonas sp.]|uniref:hypothetical protein n=1 Tax=Sphingomonas sp. TaxID=28214 RepID=UPI001D48CD42|nr:hypothetical protein [Sphingomonas sp.]MBX9797316.1 hypothetical protein [Sphingomonas sp.]